MSDLILTRMEAMIHFDFSLPADGKPCSNEELKAAFNAVWFLYKRFQNLTTAEWTEEKWSECLELADKIANEHPTTNAALMIYAALREFQARQSVNYQQ